MGGQTVSSFLSFFFLLIIRSGRLEVLTECCQIPWWKALHNTRLSVFECPVIFIAGRIAGFRRTERHEITHSVVFLLSRPPISGLTHL